MAAESKPTPLQPLLHEKYLDVPSQRLYYLSLGLLCQSIKILDFLWTFTSDDRFSTCRKWLFVDFVYCTLLKQLRIPRLHYRRTTVLLQIAMLWFFDGVMFGAVSVRGPAIFSGNVASPGYNRRDDVPSTPEPFRIFEFLSPLGLHHLSSSGLKDTHLLGQHTVHMSPIGTAHLNPQELTYCLSSSKGSVLLPILLNNTNPSALRFSVTPLGNAGQGEVFSLSAKDLKAMEQSQRDHAVPTRLPGRNGQDSNDYDEYDDDDDDITDHQNSHPELQKTQSLTYLRISKPGVIRLENVFDSSDIEARLIPSAVVVAPCPEISFVENESLDNIHCAGQTYETHLAIGVFGIPPLSLKWLKTINGKREQFVVEGIEGDHTYNLDEDNIRHNEPRIAMPQKIQIPLAISLEKPGTYLYALEEVTDGVGNIVRAGGETIIPDLDSTSKTKTTRSFIVLHTPTVAYEHCNSVTPTSMLIGSEALLTAKVTGIDHFDAPWDVYMTYQPSINAGAGRKLMPWKKTMRTQGNHQELVVRANSPGDYSIVGIKGKYCTGEVLAPDTCKVVEKPLPSAEIEWKRIYECSGDTGVSASLILRGTPPFQVFYRTQRDNETPRERSKTFTSSRGELILQPESSGQYTFTFVHMSDANYKKVELQGPSIDQLIHPLASADFTYSNMASGKSKRSINSCAGDFVDVDVDLKGTGPWNLDMQIIGPHTSEILQIQDIQPSRKNIKIPIPESVKTIGGSFEIDIISVEDVYKCKRAVSVPGIVVNVKRTQPTVQFYGKESSRHITVTENKTAELPLRLTGDGPWRIRYRRESENVVTTVLKSQNDYLSVTKSGTYQLLEVSDSQCPGIVIPTSSTYKVDWIPRPSAKLSTHTQAVFTTYNGSYILQTVCEGTNDHVDLDLTGQPPFQIMYNIAQHNDAGGTKLIDQPVFNSIQPHTRFQLQTSTPGRMYYEVKQIGDAAYPLAKNKEAVIPRNDRLLFEQQIAQRPSARFKNRNRMTYCLNDVFAPLDLSSSNGLIVLEGTPPFTLKLSIKDLAASQVQFETVAVSDRIWNVNLPSYTFKSIGPHLIKIESVVDSSNCGQTALDPLHASVWVDVAETAAIIPIERRRDICVGEVTQFQLEGIPPWTVGYRINSKHHAQEARVSPFSLLQQQAGEFTITSIAHQQKMCKAVVTDLKFDVHALPSAQVGHGKRVYQDIHEGDQAEIVFTLIGEPPFTFTYQRAEPVPKKGGKPGRVLETHTVSRVLTHEYSVFSALEGTWTVTSISDRYCRYPPAQPDISIEKH